MPTEISWADDSLNLAPGCSLKSEGCGMARAGSDDPGVPSCYAIQQAWMRAHNPNPKVADAYAGLVYRRADGRLDWTGKVNLLPERLEIPLRWRKPRRIFVNSMGDLFNDAVPDDLLVRLFAVAAACPRHTFILLTKNHARMRSFLRDECRCGHGHAPGVHLRSAMEWASTPHSETYVPGLEAGGYHRWRWPLPNVWVGVSVESQQWADIRIPALLDTPAAVRWLSCEPLLGPVDLDGPVDEHGGRPRLTYWLTGRPGWGEPEPGPVPLQPLTIGPRIDWVVAGGESGPGARPMHPAWARSLRDQCQAAGAAFHFKQHGEWSPDQPANWRDYRDDRRVTFLPDGTRYRVTEPDMLLDPNMVTMFRVGRAAAGREFDGRVWDEYPTPVAVTS